MFGSLSKRYTILCLETAEEYLIKKAMKLEIAKKEADIYRKKVEGNGVCEGCGSKDYLRWVHNGECYLCSECFIHDLQCQAEVKVPIHRAEEMDGYGEYCLWVSLWEEENGII